MNGSVDVYWHSSFFRRDPEVKARFFRPMDRKPEQRQRVNTGTLSAFAFGAVPVRQLQRFLTW